MTDHGVEVNSTGDGESFDVTCHMSYAEFELAYLTAHLHGLSLNRYLCAAATGQLPDLAESDDQNQITISFSPAEIEWFKTLAHNGYPPDKFCRDAIKSYMKIVSDTQPSTLGKLLTDVEQSYVDERTDKQTSTDRKDQGQLPGSDGH